jgi:signal transduction histidine kinase
VIGARANRVRVPWLLDAAVVAAGVLTIALLLFSTRMTSATLDSTASSKSELASLKQQIGLSHVWLEEALAGDRTIDVERQVFASIAAARSSCLGLSGTEPAAALSRLCAHLKDLRALAAQRWKSRAAARPGSRQDQRYDAAFNTSLAVAGEVEHSLSEQTARARATVNRINAGIVFAVFLIFGGMTLVVARRARQLAAYNERLRRLDGLKDNLMASVSHELRTPLTSTIGFLQTVERSDVDLDDETQRELIAIARVQAQRLARLVDDLLFFAQVENAGIRLSWGNVDVVRLAEECVQATKPGAQEKGVALRFTSEPLPHLRGDRARIAQLLDNLVSNAVKFTPAGGQVEVAVEGDDAEVRVEVSDSGIGVPEAEQPQLFERFFRANAAVENAIGGTGLGLPIAKAIVEAHDGAISIKSEEGRGTTVFVRLPLVVSSSSAARSRSRVPERPLLSR